MAGEAFADVTATNVHVVCPIGVATITFGGDAPIALPEPGMFVRAVSGLGSAFAVVKGNNSATGECRVISRGGTVTGSQGGTYGNYPLGLMIMGAQLLVVWVSSASTYSSRLFDAALTPAGAATVHSTPAQFIGTSQGFLDLNADGSPIWTDSRRTLTVKGLPLVYPVNRSIYWIGQGGGTLSAQICGTTVAGRRFTVYQGEAFEPHAALDADGTHVHIVTRALVGAPQFFTIPPLPAFQGSIQGGSAGADDALAVLGDTNLYPPVRQSVDQQGGLMTKEWQRWSQEVSGVAAQALSTANQVTQAGVTPPVPGVPPGSGGAGAIELTGDVTGGPVVSPIPTTIAAHAVSNTKFRQSTGLSVVGRSASSTGDVADIVAAANHTFLSRELNTVGWTSVDVSTADIAGRLPYANLTASSSASRLLGRTSASAGDWQEVSLDTDLVLAGTVLSTQAGIYRGRSTFTNAQILTLPSTPVAFGSVAPGGYQLRLISLTMIARITTAYIGIDPTYADIHVQVPAGGYIAVGPADVPYTTPLVRLSSFLGTSLSDIVVNLIPYTEAIQSAGGDGDWGIIQPTLLGVGDVDGVGWQLAMANAAGDLGGGNVANHLTLNYVFTVEQL